MAWTTPITAVVNSIFTASQWNTGVRDNLAVTAPGIATTAGRLIVSNGANSVAQREVKQDSDDAAGTTTSTSYTSTLSGGSSVAVTVDCGYQALIFTSMNIANSATGTSACSFSVSGNTTSIAIDGRALMLDGGGAKDDRMGVSNLFGNLTSPGSHTFTTEFKATSGTGTFTNRRMVVIAL